MTRGDALAATTSIMLRDVIIGLGANLGDRVRQLTTAADVIREFSGAPDAWRSSPVYETTPVSELLQPNYLNAVIVGRTALAPGELLAHMQQVERELGRNRDAEQSLGRNAPRPIDCDVLDYDGLLIDLPPTLVLPHPNMHERWFVMRPLLDVVPEWRHPVSGVSAAEILGRLAVAGNLHAPPLL